MKDFIRNHFFGLVMNAVNILMFVFLICADMIGLGYYVLVFLIDCVLIKMQVDSKKRNLDLILYIIAALGALALIINGFDVIIDLISKIFD